MGVSSKGGKQGGSIVTVPGMRQRARLDDSAGHEETAVGTEERH